jgi:hypothetical protein
MCTIWRRVLWLSFAAVSVVRAEEISGTVSGRVADEFGGVLPGARVTLIEEQTSERRDTTSDASGAFRFQGLPPGGYIIKVEVPGFRTLEWRGNPVGARSHLSFGTLPLTVGSGETYVGSGAKVDTEDAQRVAAIPTGQLEPIASRSGDLTTLLRTLPGVRYSDALEVFGHTFASPLPNIDGQRIGWNHITVDGVNANELGGTERLATTTALGAVAEVKVFSGGYRAELGRTGGANIRIVTRSGGARYTLSPYWDERRSAWAEEPWDYGNYQRVYQRMPPPESHLRRIGVTVGGPLAFPNARHRQTDGAMSFFYSFESVQSLQPGPIRQYHVPTAAERNGIFAWAVLDPLTGRPFPGNVIPPDRIDRSGQALLYQLPLPTSTGYLQDFPPVVGGWPLSNFTTRQDNRSTRFNHVLRLDWRPSPKDRLFLSLNTYDAAQRGSEIPGGPADWGFFDGLYDNGNRALGLGYTRALAPRLVNDFHLGARRQTEAFGWATEADRRRTERGAVGWEHGQFHPELNTLGAIPQVFFGLGTYSPDFVYDHRLGSSNDDWLVSVRDDVTWTRNHHTYKAGLYLERAANNEARGGLWMGTYDFSVDSSNPLSAGYAYANALLGNFRRYEEWDSYRATRNRSSLVEGYVQDTWKVHSRLTLDYGVRVLWYTPLHQADQRTAAFVPERYDPSRAPRLYRPVRIDGVTYAQDPGTGALVNAAYVGAFVPGTGDPTNGMVAASDPTYPRGFRENQGLHPEPRVGLAWDVTGDHKTALHFHAGLFHQARIGGGTQGNLVGPPTITQGVLINGRAAELRQGPSLEQRPSAVRGLDRDAKTPSTYKLSVGVQRDLGWGLVADVAYVGALGRHLPIRRDINAVPDGARFADVRPENRDPRYNVAVPLPSEFLRPYSGWQSIVMTENWGTSSYNALQASLARRYMRGLQFSVAYTFSKALGLGGDDDAFIEIYRPFKEWHYGPASYSQAHVVVATFAWDLPSAASRFGGSSAARALFDGWQISGEAVRASGDWAGVSLATTDGFNFDGGDNGTRPRMIGDPSAAMPAGSNTSGALFNIDAFARPTGRGDFGNTPRSAVQLPGFENLNLSLLKTVKLRSRAAAQFRIDLWNALNTKQVADVDRLAYFDPAGRQVNGDFGLSTAFRRPREIQISARFKFY